MFIKRCEPRHLAHQQKGIEEWDPWQWEYNAEKKLFNKNCSKKENIWEYKNNDNDKKVKMWHD